MRELVTVPIERLDPKAKLPTYSHADDAGADVCALEQMVVPPHSTRAVRTGLRFAVPRGYELQVRPRSGLSLNTKLRIANSPGTIDCGFAGEVLILIDNHSAEDFVVTQGLRICQLVLQQVPQALFTEVADITAYLPTDRKGGFGSTDRCGTHQTGKDI
ncbi:MAG: Deoxyuridine 5'-triphosphate nucleotidohydrolase [Firmicutes bacterium]|nr:Deoxyuridine 5'-triphosphate nucleotidohydrolase [candidate division NPL-UPA2 bacterium]MBT9153605.1 Deoxyuridine 5'-triphosphate nucleotidohydrolase [candidate division NPL-UPA2 bacterium]MBT9155564.1 Deoxyuridine 5'-triphosphate nucleotidohydrolase [candidate division NPL-UPA2 bacterium]